MNDKNLLEKLGIIQRVDEEGENVAVATKADVEVAKEVTPSLAELTFVDNSVHIEPEIAEYEIPVIESKVKAIEEPPVIEKPVAVEPVEEFVPPEKPKSKGKISRKEEIMPTETLETDELLNEIIETDDLVTYDEPVVDFAPEIEETPEYEEPFNYDKYTSIAELYKIFEKKSGGVDTIFIVDAFSKSLPDNLSKNIKRQSVLNIIDASKINLDQLVSDGLERIENINGYMKTFTDRTNDILAQKEAEVIELEDQIKLLKKEIKERNRLQDKQMNAVELETHKIRTTLEFVSSNAEE